MTSKPKFDPPSLLSYLISFGHAPHPDEPLPPEWQAAYDAVRSVRGTQEDRMEAFARATDDVPNAFSLMMDVLAATPAGANPRHQPSLLPAAGTLAHQPILDWCVEGLLTRPSLNLFVGASGSKRTSLAFDLAVCVSLGQPWLARKTVALPVLILAGNKDLPLLRSVMLAHAAPAETPLHFLPSSSYDLESVTETAELEQKIQSLGVGLLVIDSLADLMRTTFEKRSLTIQGLFNVLRRLSETCRATVLVVHQTTKAGDYRGPSTIAAAVDLILQLESPPGSSLVTLKPLKTRYTKLVPFHARSHFEGDKVWFTPAQGHTFPKLGKMHRAILTFLASHGPALSSQLINNFPDRTPDGIRKPVNDLMVMGFVTRGDASFRANPAIYHLTPKGREYLRST